MADEKRRMVALRPEVHDQLKAAAATQGIPAGKLVETMLASMENDRVKELVPEQAQLISDAEKAAEKLVRAVAEAVESAGTARADARDEYERRLSSLAAENEALRSEAEQARIQAEAGKAAARAAEAEKETVEARLSAVQFGAGRFSDLLDERNALREKLEAALAENASRTNRIHALETELAVAVEKNSWLERALAEKKEG